MSHSFLASTSTLWNSHTENIRKAPSRSVFKQLVQRYYHARIKNQALVHSSENQRLPRAGSFRVASENRSVADALAQNIRVLCWILTYPKNHLKAYHVKATWGQRCNVLLFMSSKADRSLPIVKLPIKEDPQYLWGKTKLALNYIYENHREDADWFLKADDDTYVIMENLRHFLSNYETEDPLILGKLLRFTTYTPQGYMHGGAGYVLSRSALDAFINNILNETTPRSFCKPYAEGHEDIQLARCLSHFNVQFIDSQDDLGSSLFNAFTPDAHLFPDRHKYAEWYWTRLPSLEQKGIDCCSSYAITFHQVTSRKMYELEYFIYRLRPYGIKHKYQPRNFTIKLPTKRNDEKSYLKSQGEYYYLWKSNITKKKLNRDEPKKVDDDYYSPLEY